MWEPIANIEETERQDKLSSAKQREAGCWEKFYAVIICAFVASTGLFHGYDNGVVNGVFTMTSFREMMGLAGDRKCQRCFLGRPHRERL